MTTPKSDELSSILARMGSAQQSPEAYQAMLRDMPDSAKRSFVEMTPAIIREHAVRHVTTKLKNQPEMAKLLTTLDVKRIAESVYNNMMEDQAKVRKILNPELDSFGSRSKNMRVRSIRG